MRKICAVLEMPSPMASTMYNDHRKAVHHAAKIVAEKSMTGAALDVIKTRGNAGVENLCDIAVTTDRA